jgi:glutamate racemase
MIKVPMTEPQFAAATQRLRANGIELTGTNGTLSKDGVTAKYTYADGKLAVEVLDRPFLLPLSLIESKLQAYLEQSVAYDAGKATS